MNQIFAAESDHPLFRYFEEQERDRIESLAESIVVEAGDFLIRGGQKDSTLYSVESGRLEIVTASDDGVRILATVGTGDVLGEVSFIDDSPRSVSVRAGERTVVRAWDRDILSSVLGSDPKLLAKFSVAMCELLVERLRDTVRLRGSFRPV